MSVTETIAARLLRWAARRLSRSSLIWLTPSLLKTAEQLDPQPVPDFAYAHMLWEAGKIEDADQALKRILAVYPDQPDANNLAGILLFQAGQLPEAVPFFQRAISHNPRFVAPQNNLGNVYKEQGRLDEAARCYAAALSIDPDYVEALTNLGIVFNLRGDNEVAEKYCRRAVELAPDFAGAHCNLGNVLLSLTRGGEAIAEYRRALELSPQLPEALVNLSLVLEEPAYLIDTIGYYEKLLARQPQSTLALLRIAQALQALNQWDEAFQRLEQAVALNPAQPDVRFIRAVNLAHIGDARGVVAEFDQVPLMYRSTSSESSRAFHSVYLPELKAEAVCDALRCWGESHAARPASRYTVVPDSNRQRLRVGYVSRDFGGHSVAYFLEPILRHHDAERFEVFCYSTRFKEDAVTLRFKELVPHWRDISTWSEKRVVDQIIEDEIDVLVDLSGHTSGNRLMVFACKPAPVQVTYLGFPATTGISRIDYRLTDRVADPEPVSQAHFVERLHYLPDCFLCYQPSETAPDVATAPGGTKGFITFCSFNNSIKINEQTVGVWSRILRELPDARLLLKSFGFTSQRGRQRVRSMFEAERIGPERVELVDWKEDSKDHLSLYHDADIALDTFPYNGTTTTCEALWMGVPVVAMAGDRHSARVGASLLNALGLNELVAQDVEGYARIAVQLARDPEKLAALRAALRPRMSASMLLDQKRFTLQLEATYFDMWRAYCEEAVQMEKVPDKQAAVDLPLATAGRLHLPNTYRVMSRYVLEEQGDWFEDEIRFIRKLIQPGQHVLDIGANYGVYTLSLSALVGPQGKVAAFEPDEATAAYLLESLRRNGYGQAQVIGKAVSDHEGTARFKLESNSELNRVLDDNDAGESVSVALTTLDGWFRESSWTQVDFIKIDAEGQEANVVIGASGLLAKQSPLVMAEFKHGHGFNDDMLQEFSNLGYGMYRLVPGLGVLAPFQMSEEPDDFLLNLFFCKEDKARQLESTNFLARDLRLEAPYEPMYQDVSRKIVRSDAGPVTQAVVEQAFQHYLAARNETNSAAARYAALLRAHEIIEQACSETSDVNVRMSYARILADLGLRVRAGDIFEQLFEELERSNSESAVCYLMPDTCFETAASVGNLRNWKYAAVSEWLARNLNFSSYFNPGQAIRYWQALRRSGYRMDEAQRQIDLILRYRAETFTSH